MTAVCPPEGVPLVRRGGAEPVGDGERQPRPVGADPAGLVVGVPGDRAERVSWTDTDDRRYAYAHDDLARRDQPMDGPRRLRRPAAPSVPGGDGPRRRAAVVPQGARAVPRRSRRLLQGRRIRHRHRRVRHPVRRGRRPAHGGTRQGRGRHRRRGRRLHHHGKQLPSGGRGHPPAQSTLRAAAAAAGHLRASGVHGPAAVRRPGRQRRRRIRRHLRRRRHPRLPDAHRDRGSAAHRPRAGDPAAPELPQGQRALAGMAAVPDGPRHHPGTAHRHHRRLSSSASRSCGRAWVPQCSPASTRTP